MSESEIFLWWMKTNCFTKKSQKSLHIQKQDLIITLLLRTFQQLHHNICLIYWTFLKTRWKHTNKKTLCRTRWLNTSRTKIFTKKENLKIKVHFVYYNKCNFVKLLNASIFNSITEYLPLYHRVITAECSVKYDVWVCLQNV